MEPKQHLTAKLTNYLFDCVKLSTLTPEAAVGDGIGSQAFESLAEKAHLLCLSDREALMLFSLLQAALRHEESQRTLLSAGDYKRFHRTLSAALANGLAEAGHQTVKKST
jgi:hypothetical protein